MILKEIKLINIDRGAPLPKIVASENDLFLLFYEFLESGIPIKGLEQSDISLENKVVVVKFPLFSAFKMGPPSNETLSGHPYYRIGLKSYFIYDLEDSPWKNELIEIQKIHPYYNSQKYNDLRHYIFTFHDSMFECLAQNFEILHKSNSMSEALQEVLASL